jgi:Fuseless
MTSKFVLFSPVSNARTLGTHVLVGMGAASFWRGAWYVLDDHLYPNQPAQSAAASLALGTCGMAASQGLVARAEQWAQQLRSNSPPPRALVALARFGAIYTVAISVVLVWRGTWVGWDCLYEHWHDEQQPKANNHHAIHYSVHEPTNHRHLLMKPLEVSAPAPSTNIVATASLLSPVSSTSHSTLSNSIKSTDPGHATHSGLLSHLVAVSLLLGTGLFASVLAPPAAVSVIRDQSVRGKSASAYQGLAQTTWDQFVRFRPSSAASSVTHHSSRSHHSVAALHRLQSTYKAPKSPLPYCNVSPSLLRSLHHPMTK